MQLKQLLLLVLLPTIFSVSQMSKSHVRGAPRDGQQAAVHTEQHEQQLGHAAQCGQLPAVHQALSSDCRACSGLLLEPG